ncbi:MAG TPA: AI-2E family transporter [Caulobacteraceae bacterium]|nr:AI-2E family transporter [Caulobacteraceae bacterium]
MKDAGAPPLTALVGRPTVSAAIVFIAVVVAGVLVRIFQEFLAPLVVAVFLLLLIDALARDLNSRFPEIPRLIRGVSAGVLIIAGFTAVILLLVVQGPPFALQFAAIEPKLNAVIGQLMRMAGQAPLTVHELLRGADPVRLLGPVFGAARGGIVFFGFVMIYLGFLAAARRDFSAKLDRLYDAPHHRDQARRVIASVRSAVEHYVRLVTFKAVLIAIVAFGVMAALGVNFGLFVAFLVFLSAFVPVVGAFAGACIPALVALAQFGELTKPLIIIGGLGGAVFLIDNILMPKLQGDDLNIDPLLVLISIGFWGLMLGPTGALLSTPLSFMVMAVASEFDGARWLAILISKDGQPLKDAGSAA